jgi:hypothetical protein
MSTEQLDNLEQLGLRAVACKHWKWLGGMRVVSPAEHSGATGYTVRVESGYVAKSGEYPDLTDTATLGCLLALVREAWNDPTLGLFAARGGRSGRPARVWAFGGCRPRRRGWENSIASAFFGSEIEALVSALEVAP